MRHFKSPEEIAQDAEQKRQFKNIASMYKRLTGGTDAKVADEMFEGMTQSQLAHLLSDGTVLQWRVEESREGLLKQIRDVLTYITGQRESAERTANELERFGVVGELKKLPRSSPEVLAEIAKTCAVAERLWVLLKQLEGPDGDNFLGGDQPNTPQKPDPGNVSVLQ